MLQVLVGFFTSYWDGENALQALQALGLTPANGHLYEESEHDPASRLHPEIPEPDLHSHERAEYDAHGEYLDDTSAANQYGAETGCAAPGTDEGSPSCGSATARTLLVIDYICGARLATACEVLFDRGAVAVKDPSGHWRFSPRRSDCPGLN
jgi:hypothetical protein